MASNAGLPAAELSNLIGLIYDCAIDPDAWDIALPAIRASIDCYSAQLGLNDVQTGRILLVRSSGVADEWLQRQPAYGGDMRDLWADVLLHPSRLQDEPLAARRLIDDTKFSSNRYYREWLEPQGQVDAALLILMQDAARIATVGFGRDTSQGYVGDRELEILGLIAPHIRRAVTISNMLDTATIAANSFAVTLDAINVGIVLVDARSEIVHANATARKMLAEGGCMRSANGKLQLTQTTASDALTAAIAKAGGDEIYMGQAGIGVPAPGSAGRPHMAHVLPLRQGVARRRLLPAAVAAVFIGPSQAGPPVPAAALRALYDLTPAEARVLVDIAAGQTPGATASALGVAEATVRTHLARVFSKTGTSRQADLVRLVGALNLPLHQ